MHIDFSQLILIAIGSFLTLSGTLLIWILNNRNEKRKEKREAINKIIQPTEEYLDFMFEKCARLSHCLVTNETKDYREIALSDFMNTFYKFNKLHGLWFIRGIQEITKNYGDELINFMELCSSIIKGNAPIDEDAILDSYDKLLKLQKKILQVLLVAKVDGYKDEFLRIKQMNEFPVRNL